MTTTRSWLRLFPPLLAGLVGAVALETSASILLYTADGFLPALTIILTVEAGALGLGIWGGPLVSGGGSTEGLRLRWLFSLVVFSIAAALTAALSFRPDLAGSGIGQGVGLGLLGGLPLFSIGSLLGSMSCPGDPGPPSSAGVGASSVFGATMGFLATGFLLLPHAATYTIYLICLVLLSAGALLQGWVLDISPGDEAEESPPEPPTSPDSDFPTAAQG